MTEIGKPLLVSSDVERTSSKSKSIFGLNSITPIMKGKEDPKQQKHLRVAIAGACAGAMAKTIVAPIERVKLLLQLQVSLSNPTYLHKTPLQVATKIFQEEGILAFWRGNYHNVLQHSGTSALNFMLMDYYKAIARKTINHNRNSNSSTYVTTNNNQMYYSFLCGGLAGSTATTVLYPIQFLRTRLAADVAMDGIRRYPRGMMDVLQSTLKVDGIRGLYQGYGIAVAGVFLYRSLHLGGYDVLKEWWRPLPIENSAQCYQSYTLSWMEKFLIAQIVSLVAGTVCYPIDTVRRRLMMQAGQDTKQYRNALHAFYGIARHEGAVGFFRGLGPNLVRSVGASLLLLSYDVILPLL
jgi:solute carrier family 25 (mitochondrial adenine nucleotide translocator), member 4/5/6/31